MGSNRRNKPKPKLEVVPPTDAQMVSATFDLQDITERRGSSSIAIGKAYKRRPMIDILFAADVLDREQYKALRHYRHHADLADCSLVRDSLCLQRGGRGSGPTISTLNAIALVRDCERAAGSLADMLRAIVVYDMSLSQWAIGRAGSIEERYERRGKSVCQIKPRRSALLAAKLEIRIAAQRVQAELDA
jgi:hypothetical protein